MVEFGDTIDADVNARVLALDQALADNPPPGFVEAVPTYRSLLVTFDPVVLGRVELQALLSEIAGRPPAETVAGTRWRVPVRYGGEHGRDLNEVAAGHGLSPDALVALHAGADYRVFMIGFAPGFAYLAGLPERIHTSRRAEPRLETPPRTISIGGQQAGVAPPIPLPSGWNLLGRTPVRSYDPARGGRPFLFAPGDRIRFVPIGDGDFERLSRAAEAGAIVAEPDG